MPRRRNALGRALRRATLLTRALLAAFALYLVGRSRPQDLPWTTLDLGERPGLFTGRKLAALGTNGPYCRALLDRAGIRYTALPARSAGQCGYDDGIRLTAGGPRRIAFAPVGLGTACPVAAALAMWEWNSVQPAAIAVYGRPVATIDHFGSYACRRIYGRDSGSWSEHATADAIDIAGFRLADGTRISVVRDWAGDAKARRFLRSVRDGACGLFATVLSPDYNAAHRDHLHLDQAARGATGWRACR